MNLIIELLRSKLPAEMEAYASREDLVELFHGETIAGLDAGYQPCPVSLWRLPVLIRAGRAFPLRDFGGFLPIRQQAGFALGVLRFVDLATLPLHKHECLILCQQIEG